MADGLVEKIVRQFDFQKVHEHMMEKNWEWASRTEELYIPTVDQLMDRATLRLRKVLERKKGGSFGGGFEVTCDGKQVTLSFVSQDKSVVERVVEPL